MYKIEKPKKSNRRLLSYFFGGNQEPSVKTRKLNIIQRKGHRRIKTFKRKSVLKRQINRKPELSNQKVIRSPIIKQTKRIGWKWAFQVDVFLIELKTQVLDSWKGHSQKNIGVKKGWWVQNRKTLELEQKAQSQK